ncbi:hypothetical protein F9K91_04875 [Brucella tritici]|uniref:Tail tape measure protein n=1 Tax=Brucella tritici TaxID=94626 RepID=A0A833CQB5_9HYPH|nr:hypothetical protein [Brucella tritici]KAB2666521.1 hypothetical protein F9K91_04875 [Brucella tritici]
MGAQAEATLTLSLIDRITGPIKRMSARVQASLAAIGKRLGFDRVTRQIRNVTRAFTGLGQGIARTAKRLSLFTALVGVGGGGLLAVLLGLSKATAEVGSEIGKLSDVAGMAPVAFQKWAFAGKTVGLESEKIADILKDVNDKIGDYFQNESGPMKDFFENIPKRVGKSAKAIQREFRGLTSSEALQLYVNYLQKANLSQADMTFYMEAIASDATLLLPLLRDNGKELNRLGREAGRAGGILGKSAIELGKKFSESQLSVMARLDGLRRFVGVQLMPVFIDLANAFNKWYDANAKLIRQKIGEWAKRLRQIFRDLLDPTSDLRRKISEFAQGFVEAYGKIKPFVDFLGGPLKAGLGLLALWVLAPAITGVALLALALGGLGKAIAGVAFNALGLAIKGLGHLFAGAEKEAAAAGTKAGGAYGRAFGTGMRGILRNVFRGFGAWAAYQAISSMPDQVLKPGSREEYEANLKKGQEQEDAWNRAIMDNGGKKLNKVLGFEFLRDKDDFENSPANRLLEGIKGLFSGGESGGRTSPGAETVLRIREAEQARKTGYKGTTDVMPGKTRDDLAPVVVQPQAQVPAPIENKTVHAPQTVNLNIHTQAMTPGEISAAVRSAMKSANDQHAEGVASSLSD